METSVKPDCNAAKYTKRQVEAPPGERCEAIIVDKQSIGRGTQCKNSAYTRMKGHKVCAKHHTAKVFINE